DVVSAAKKSGAVGIIADDPASLADQGPTQLDAGKLIFRALHSNPAEQKSPRLLDAESASRAGVLLQSSGTTGAPRIVFRNAVSLDAVAQNVADALGLTPHDRVLALPPMTHSYGVENSLLAPLWAGSAIHVMAGLDAAHAPSLIRERS